MPTVPGGEVQAPPAEKVDPTYLMIAAAQMHEQGRLLAPKVPLPRPDPRKPAQGPTRLEW